MICWNESGKKDSFCNSHQQAKGHNASIFLAMQKFIERKTVTHVLQIHVFIIMYLLLCGLGSEIKYRARSPSVLLTQRYPSSALWATRFDSFN